MNFTLEEKNRIEEKLRRNKITIFDSRFSFIKSHNGFRHKCLHTFLARTGGGKTTLVKTILFDLLKEKKVLVWLSEEDKDSLLTSLVLAKLETRYFDNLIIYSEVEENSKLTEKEIFDKIEYLINLENPQIILFDNLTTSQIVEGNFTTQNTSIRRLKKIVVNNNLPMIVMVHTSSTAGLNSMLTEECVRGSKTIANLSDYFYIMQMFEDDISKMQTIRVTKARNHSTANGKIYRLVWDNDNKNYSEDSCISFSLFKEVFSRRNKL